MSANKITAATSPAISITVSKVVLNPLLTALYKAGKDSFPIASQDVLDIIDKLENNDNWFGSDTTELEHIRIVETGDNVTITLSAELAEAYINISIKTIPVFVSIYTALINLKSIIKLSGLKEAVKNYESLLSMSRITRGAPEKKVRKTRVTKTASKAAE